MTLLCSRRSRRTAAVAEGESHIARDSGRYPLCGRGDVNTYTLFAELNRQLIRRTGRVGMGRPARDRLRRHNEALLPGPDGAQLTGQFLPLRERGVPLSGGRSLDVVFSLLTLTGRGAALLQHRLRLLLSPDGAPRRTRPPFHPHGRRDPADEPEYGDLPDLPIQARRRDQQGHLPPRSGSDP